LYVLDNTSSIRPLWSPLAGFAFLQEKASAILVTGLSTALREPSITLDTTPLILLGGYGARITGEIYSLRVIGMSRP
jgi:hypothetical protein